MNKNFIRIIPFLDIKNGLLIKGINLDGFRIMGEPSLFSDFYNKSGADEICYIDAVASLFGTLNLTNFIKKCSKKIFVPLNIGGGINSVDKINKMLGSGADKIVINTAAVEDPFFIKEASRIFGSSTITVQIQTIKINNNYYITKSSGRDIEKISPKDFAKKMQDYGAGEIIITSINHEGLKKGFDLKIIDEISSKLQIPCIAHGGAGCFEDVYNVINKTNITGVGIASLFHYEAMHYFKKINPRIGNINYLKSVKRKKKINTIKELKYFLKRKKINIRL